VELSFGDEELILHGIPETVGAGAPEGAVVVGAATVVDALTGGT